MLSLLRPSFEVVNEGWILPDQGSLLSDKFLMETYGLDVAIFLSSYQSQILTLADKQ
jgi:hypothetical protein